MKVGFTGTRHGMSLEQINKLKYFFNHNFIEEFHHGQCIGADAQAHQLAWDSICSIRKIILHPSIDKRYRAHVRDGDSDVITRKPKESLVRNRDIVDDTDILIASPRTKNEEQRSGTWSTIRYAKKKGKKVIIL